MNDKPATTTEGWRFKLLLVATSTLLTLAALSAAGEVGVRYHERHRSTVPGTEPLLYYRHKRLGSALVRHSDYFGWAHVNGQGFRGVRPTFEDARGAFRIMVVGASTVFDGFVTRDDRAWPQQLETWLRGHSENQRVEVVNAGVPGYVLLDNLIRLQSELYRYHPDLLILYHGHNELFHTLRAAAIKPVISEASTDRPDEMQPVTPWVHWLESHSMLYAKLLARWKALRWVDAGLRAAGTAGLSADAWQSAIASGAEGFRRDLRAFLAVAGSHGIPVVLVEVVHITPPTATTEVDSEIRVRWRYTVPTASPEVVLAGYQRFNAVIREEGARFRVPAIGTEGFGLHGRRWYSEGDPIHFNDAGAGRMAELMGQALLTRRLVPITAP